MDSSEASLIALLIVLGLFLLIILFIKVSRSRHFQPPPLLPAYVRLGQLAPSAPCPCGRGGADRSYESCCRADDVKALDEDIRQYLWQYWSHRSYSGRRRSRSMEHRLQDFPLPPVVLPPWVTSPEKYTFPIAEETLRAWSPLEATQVKGKEVPEDTGLGDVI